MFVDTLFPNVYRPTFLEFEPTIWWSEIIPPSESRSYPYRHEHNSWLAKKFPFRLNTLSITEEGAACSLCWHLGGGSYLHTNCLDPRTGEFCDDPRWLYLVLAYQHKDEWDGSPLFPKLKKWIRHLENMPNNPVEAVFARATDCRVHKYRHLKLTGMRMPVNASSERLDRCYRKYFGATDWKYQDSDGKPYLKWKFRPKYPKK